VAKKPVAKKPVVAAAVHAPASAPTPAASPAIRTVLNPAAAWPFPTGIRP